MRARSMHHGISVDLVARYDYWRDRFSADDGLVVARIRKVLVVVQVAVALVPLVGSGPFVQTLRKLHEVDPGFRTTNLVRFKLDPT